MKFEVGKKYVLPDSKFVKPYTICRYVTGSGVGLGEYPNGRPCLMYDNLDWVEYIEPPLAAGDLVLWRSQVTPSEIKAIVGEEAWIVNTNTTLDYIVPLNHLKRA